LRQAGHKAASRSAHREAAACFGQALTVLGHLADSREAREQAIDLRLELRASLFTLGELSRIPEVLGEAEAIATAIGDRRRQGLALVSLSNYYDQIADSARTGDYAERALAIARELGDPGIEAQATLRLGATLFRHGEYRQAIDLLGRAVPGLQEHPLEHLHGESGALGCLCLLARALIEVGEFVPAMDRAKEAIQFSEAADAAFGLVHGHFALGFAHLCKGTSSAQSRRLNEASASLAPEACPFWNPSCAPPWALPMPSPGGSPRESRSSSWVWAEPPGWGTSPSS
jgi:tetratricopeptide (TPR) repeat protein